MSLNPSNGIAAEMNPGKTTFPNLARSDASDEEKRALDWTCAAELSAAGIKAVAFEAFRRNGEVPTAVMGELPYWGFRRAWYYWIAEGAGIPPEIAQPFWQQWGWQVRTLGDAGRSRSPLDLCGGFAVGSYHIDTQEGLNAFAALLREIQANAGKAPPDPAIAIRAELADELLYEAAKFRKGGHEETATLLALHAHHLTRNDPEPRGPMVPPLEEIRAKVFDG